MQGYYKEGGCHGRQAFRLDVDKKYYHGNVFSRQVNLAYNSTSYYTSDIISLLRYVILIWKLYE